MLFRSLLNESKAAIKDSNYRITLVAIQLSLERFMKLLSIVMEHLPNFITSEENKLKPSAETTGKCRYVRSDSTKNAIKYLAEKFDNDKPTLPERGIPQNSIKLCISALIICVGVVNKVLIDLDILLNRIHFFLWRQ